MEDKIDEIVNEGQEPVSSFSGISQVPQLEEFIERFSNRYKSETVFREIVHDFLDLSGSARLRLAVGKKVFKGWYAKKTDKMIEAYAIETRDSIQEVYDANLTDELLALSQAEQTLLNNTDAVRGANDYLVGASDAYQQSITEKEEQTRNIADEFENKKDDIESKLEDQKSEVNIKTDATRIAKEKLKTFIESSEYVSNESGVLQFDEQQIVKSLEDIFLDEIVKGIETSDGHSGFMSNLKRTYDGVVDHWDEMEDLSELSDVDWVQSTIYSRTRGYRKPQFPYLIVGKSQSFESTKVSIDTAMSLDLSGSMEGDRFSMAQKTVLANHSLMRQLNPSNNVYLSVYSQDSVRPVSTADLMKNVHPYGGTPTHLALDWLFNVLQGKGPSIAYLISDGAPDSVEAAINSASKFRDCPEIMLRLFLIDGNSSTRAITKEIGMAAGPDTKVVPVSNGQFAGGMIRDVGSAIGGLYDIKDF